MASDSPAFETRCLSSLSKVFADSDLDDAPVTSGTALWGEVFSFQVAYRATGEVRPLYVSADSPLLPYLTLRAVGLSPSELPAYAEPDSGYIRTKPGLFPDPLYPLSEGGLHALPGQWRSLWVTVKLPVEAEFRALIPGEERLFAIDLSFRDENGCRLGGERCTLEIIPAELPPQKLVHTEWFHCDCLATHYDAEVFGEKHWMLIERYVRNAVEHGVNLLLTPLFTPPLDTAVGGERPTVQLVGVEQTGEHDYRFDFGRLERWIDMSLRAGIRYFEFSHLFTQWGAKHAPKIMAAAGGEEKRIFGWETEAAGEAYGRFLDQFLPALDGFIQARGLADRVYFHVSDEPNGDQLASYRQASQLLKRHLGGYAFIEALSDYAFYEEGLVPIPIPANNHIEPFLAQGVDPLWTYYCCGQHRDVSNRFFSLPSSRNRILGLQLYKFNIRGFLHWGYNFWYSRHSTRQLDPYRVTDADGAFPSGDAFVVYPGPEGPVDSIRWEVFREAQQDLRALELLESLAGRDRAMALIEEELDEALSFRNYPDDAGWLLGTRDKINRAIRAAMD